MNIKATLTGLLVSLAVIGSFLLGMSLRGGASLSVEAPKSFTLTYSDFVVLLLTCIAILLTILGVGIAILTIVGIKNVRTVATKQAYSAAKAELDNPESSISKRILKVAESSAYQGVESIASPNSRNYGEFD